MKVSLSPGLVLTEESRAITARAHEKKLSNVKIKMNSTNDVLLVNSTLPDSAASAEASTQKVLYYKKCENVFLKKAREETGEFDKMFDAIFTEHTVNGTSNAQFSILFDDSFSKTEMSTSYSSASAGKNVLSMPNPSVHSSSTLPQKEDELYRSLDSSVGNEVS